MDIGRFDWKQTVYKEIPRRFGALELEGSGWNCRKVVGMKYAITKYIPLKGGSYIPLPDCILKKAIINVKNGNKCCMWAVLCELQPASKDENRVSKYENYQNELV